MPSFRATSPSFVQDRHNTGERHLFMGIARGVIILVPTGTIGNGVISFDDHGKQINKCKVHLKREYHYADDQVMFEAFCCEYSRVMRYCYDDAELEFKEFSDSNPAKPTLKDSYLRTSVYSTETTLCQDSPESNPTESTFVKTHESTLHLKASVPCSVLSTKEPFEYRALIKSIRITGYSKFGTRLFPLIEVHEMKILTDSRHPPDTPILPNPSLDDNDMM